MNLFDKIGQWWSGLFRRRRLSLLNTRDNHEVWHTHISPMNILMAIVASVILMFTIILTLVAYTPVLELLPGYSAEAHRSRRMIIDNIVRLDSLERVIDEMLLYTDNVSLIMDGKSPVVRSASPIEMNSSKSSKELVLPNEADSVLRRKMEGEGRYNLRAAMAINSEPLVSPVDGVIIRRFGLDEGSYGVSVATSAEQCVMATHDGVVALSVWTPDRGYTISLLHSSSVVSTYQNIPHTSLKMGDVVKAGEVIGYNIVDSRVVDSGVEGSSQGSQGSQSSQPSSRQIDFELWIDGRPVDPERYIIF